MSAYFSALAEAEDCEEVVLADPGNTGRTKRESYWATS